MTRNVAEYGSLNISVHNKGVTVWRTGRPASETVRIRAKAGETVRVGKRTFKF